MTIGIDIGTTTISFAVKNENKILEIQTISSEAGKDRPYGMQQVEVITRKVLDALALLTQSYGPISAIGLTGQMHGVLYTNEEGKAVSDLYTWQNTFGDMLFEEVGKTYCEYLSEKNGQPCATGYGLVTDFWLRQNHKLPENAWKLCTIMDYVGMLLTNRKEPLLHPSNAASLGFYDITENCFYKEILADLGVDIAVLPEIGKDGDLLGCYNGIPVCIAIGDNQASFLGATQNESGCVLINVGTGSQISFVCDKSDIVEPGIELRPYIESKYLKCYSALCGGAAYALVEKFFRKIYTACTGEEREIYDILDKLVEGCDGVDHPKVDTCFKGTRENPKRRGSIADIHMQNFTPEHFIYGVMDGIAQELYEAYLLMDHGNETKTSCRQFVASGNCIRKNKLLQDILSEKFCGTMELSKYMEEAAVGAACFAEITILTL